MPSTPPPTHVSPSGWDHDLHALYSAYLGHFQSHSIPWYEQSWAPLFKSFDAFLGFGWPAVVVVDARTRKAVIATRAGSLKAFERMAKMRYPDPLPHLRLSVLPTLSPTSPTACLLHTISSISAYNTLHASLPAHAFVALSARVRSGEPRDVLRLWTRRAQAFCVVEIVRSERGGEVMEVGYAVVRCGHLDAMNVWPPNPVENYRKGHYVVKEYADVRNHAIPNRPYEYTWGQTEVVSRSALAIIISAILSGLTSSESDIEPNALVLVGHDMSATLSGLAALNVHLPSNTLLLPTYAYEHALFRASDRPTATHDPVTGRVRSSSETLSLPALLLSLNVPLTPQVPLANVGNAAFLGLLAFQLLVDPHNTVIPGIPSRQFPQLAPLQVSPPASTTTAGSSRSRRHSLPLERVPSPSTPRLSFSSHPTSAPSSALPTPSPRAHARSSSSSPMNGYFGSSPSVAGMSFSSQQSTSPLSGYVFSPTSARLSSSQQFVSGPPLTNPDRQRTSSAIDPRRTSAYLDGAPRERERRKSSVLGMDALAGGLRRLAVSPR